MQYLRQLQYKFLDLNKQPEKVMNALIILYIVTTDFAQEALEKLQSV